MLLFAQNEKTFRIKYKKCVFVKMYNVAKKYPRRKSKSAWVFSFLFIFTVFCKGIISFDFYSFFVFKFLLSDLSVPVGQHFPAGKIPLHSPFPFCCGSGSRTHPQNEALNGCLHLQGRCDGHWSPSWSLWDVWFLPCPFPPHCQPHGNRPCRRGQKIWTLNITPVFFITHTYVKYCFLLMAGASDGTPADPSVPHLPHNRW